MIFWNISHNSRTHISKRKRRYNEKSSAYHCEDETFGISLWRRNLRHIIVKMKISEDVIMRNLRHIIVKMKSSADHCEDKIFGISLWRQNLRHIIVKTKIPADFKIFTLVIKFTSDSIDRINNNNVQERSKKSWSRVWANWEWSCSWKKIFFFVFLLILLN